MHLVFPSCWQGLLDIYEEKKLKHKAIASKFHVPPSERANFVEPVRERRKPSKETGDMYVLFALALSNHLLTLTPPASSQITIAKQFLTRLHLFSPRSHAWQWMARSVCPSIQEISCAAGPRQGLLQAARSRRKVFRLIHQPSQNVCYTSMLECQMTHRAVGRFLTATEPDLSVKYLNY